MKVLRTGLDHHARSFGYLLGKLRLHFIQSWKKIDEEKGKDNIQHGINILRQQPVILFARVK